MNLIQEFYKNLDTLELIIFWGIILVIILTIILLVIIVNKKKKEIKIQTNEYQEELPIIIETPLNQESNNIEFQEEFYSNNEENNLLEEMEPLVEMPEENVEIETHKDMMTESNKYKTTFEMPTAPYQRNVLREMSLSQTSPIGINRKDDYKKPEDLFEIYNKHEEKQEIKEPETKEEIIKLEEPFETNIIEELPEEMEPEILNEKEKNDNLDIERTQYEIEQEENAIISYKELMEKKDSIQTIDEEDAIISIEELLNKTNNKEETQEETKLYNISEEEENDSFINELKQFRKDL